MTKCQVCGEEVTDSKFCPNCGSVIESQQKEEVVEPKEELVEVNQEETQSSYQSNKTKFCTNCGTEVDINAAACTNCGAALSDLPNAQGPSKKFCTNCGSEIDVNAIVCPRCGVSTGSKVGTEQKSAALGILLNFFIPGLGHIACDFTHRGVNFLVMYIVSVILAFFIIGIILVPVVWIWAMIDVNNCVKKENAGEYVEEKIIF